MQDFEIFDCDHGIGRVFLPRCAWRQEFTDYVRKEAIEVVRLSYSMGWRGNELDFLLDLKHLQGLQIYSWDIHDVTVLKEMRNLKSVALECNLRKSVDFSYLRNLQILMATWSKHIESAFSCSTLKLLNITNYPGVNLEPLSSLIRLEKLALTSRILLSLEGIKAFKSLESLDLYACTKLNDLADIGHLWATMKHVEVASCKKIYDISALAKLRGLRALTLDECGNIDSLKPVSECKDLKLLSCIGSTKFDDGDIGFISEFSKLHTLRLVQRRHYSHNSDELEGGLATK